MSGTVNPLASTIYSFEFTNHIEKQMQSVQVDSHASRILGSFPETFGGARR